jgi:hypothetical protein
MKDTLLRSCLVGMAGLMLSEAPARVNASPSVKLLRTPDGGIQPQAVADSRGTLHLVYLKGDPQACDVFYIRREAGAFSTPVRVNSRQASAIAVGTVRGAQIALGRNGRVHIVWNGSSGAEPNPAGGAPMLYTRLEASGKSFEPQRNLMTSTINLDGGGSVAADTQGNVYVVWHGHPKGVEANEQSRAVFLAKSSDDGQTFGPEIRVNPDPTGVCGCCGLKAFVDPRGRLGILYRSATAAGTRDATLLVSTDQGKTFRSTVLGPWRIGSCPMSTMDAGPGPQDTMFTMWETQGQVYTARITPERLQTAAAPFAPEGNPNDRKHPACAVSQGQGSFLLMAWTEGTGWEKGGALAWECLDLGTNQKTTGRSDGVIPIWGRVTAVALDGGFTIIY